MVGYGDGLSWQQGAILEDGGGDMVEMPEYKSGAKSSGIEFQGIILHPLTANVWEAIWK